MLINLTLNENKLKEHNKLVRKLKRQYPDLPFREIKDLEDKFMPYLDFVEYLKNHNYTAVQPDYREPFDSVYVCGLNSNHDIERITNYKEARNTNSHVYWYNYGVADNASQVLDYYDSLLEKEECKEYMKERKFVILLTPIFKEDQPEDGGWRWHKWGQYIGKFESKHEYIYDEVGIDFVYVFTILEVEDC